MSKKLIYLTSFVLVLGLVVVNVAKGADPGLVGWWKFDEGSGTTTSDSSGNGNDGTFNGAPKWVDGKIGGALDFDGTDDEVYFDSVQLPTNAFTFAFWFNSDTALGASNSRADFIYWQSGGRPHLTFNRSETGEIGLWPRSSTGEDFDGPLTTTRSWAAGTWYHISATFDGTDFKIYVNGNLENVVNHPGTHVDNTGFSIGCRPDRYYFDGKIDDVRLYDIALTAEEVQRVMIGVPPGAASILSPADEATDVPRDVVLSWTPGEFAAPVDGHKVYFGENFDDVNDATVAATQDANSYAPAQRLDFNTTYYWRVDEVNAPPTSHIEFKGEVWQFTVEPIAYLIPAERITVTASSQTENQGPENTINGSGLDVNDLHSTEATDMWLSGSEPNGAWIEYELDKVHKLHEMWAWNSNQVMEPMFGLGCKDVSIEYSVNGTDYTTLGTTYEFAQGTGAADYEHNTTVDFGGAAAKYIRLTISSNWVGFLDQYGLSEVRFFYIPILAREPSPESGATDVDVDLFLSFRAGREAAEHNVYISTDEQAVIDSNVSVSIVTEAQDGPISLDLGETYYWKVNEVNMAETTTTWQGEIWNFTTPEFFVVDDFEDYNDYPPNEIWSTWVDGYGVPTNGATSGYPAPDFLAGEHYVETTTVHGGEQAMPFFYDNTGAAVYSEGECTFAVPQDWTKAGVQALVLYFQGSPGNTGHLYVKVNGSKVVYPGDAVDITRPRWKQWGIDLALFGVDLQNVTTLAIGIDDSGASGTLYLDDIGLYPSVPEQTALEIWIEAEAADSITEPMKIYPAAGVDPVKDAGGKGEPSGGLYIGTTSDVPGNNDNPGTQDIATYTFTVPTAGTYAIWGRVSNVDDDSLWVHIPDGQYDVPVHSSGWIQWNSIEPEIADWHWVRVHSNDAPSNAVVNVTLTAGQHTILWAHRENENFLDAFVITDKLD